MTLRRTSKSQKWPRFGDVILHEGGWYRLAAIQQAPGRGFVLRPTGADDAEMDIFLPFSAWQEFRWNPTAEQWQQSAAPEGAPSQTERRTPSHRGRA